jgi:hypothetical protein
VTELPADIGSRIRRATESLHSLVYFAPETEQHLTDAGLRPGRMCYFAGRSAPMGAVRAGVTAATFYNFNPEIVARHIPRAWTLASPEAIVAARFRAADAALRRLLGQAIDGEQVREGAQLARTAASALTPEGRPLYAAHADLDWPDEPHLVLWHALSLLREYRGDGHVAVLLQSGLSGIESIVTHTFTGRGFTEQSAKTLRGWSDEQWDAAVEGLRARGLVDDDGGLTAAGAELRQQIEDATDSRDRAAAERLGADGTTRLLELGKGLTRIVVGNGAFPDGVFAARR